MEAMAKLSKLWKSRDISFPTKLKLYTALVPSVLLCGCLSWSLTAEIEKRIQAFEMKCSEHKTSNSVRLQVVMLAGTQEPLRATVVT